MTPLFDRMYTAKDLQSSRMWWLIEKKQKGGERTRGGFVQNARDSGRREEERRRQRQERFPTPEPRLITEEEAEEDALARELLKTNGIIEDYCWVSSTNTVDI
ncbi:hypothetical protein L1987_02058 [Smallanthus sonchifolius]|uniref:Uncharacterized protein n=1 Tax=Smallanthus sonchifolius TaxID=185202 RepID=A0ACB9K6S6_9ASTR|nr:hypothetical protein L1987_02058 [Smallanthus sonchifolius]